MAGHNRPRPATETERPVDATAADFPGPDFVGPIQSDSTDLTYDELDEPGPPRPRWPFVLVIVAAVLAGAGVFFTVKASSGGEPGVDTQAMTEVNGQVKAGLEKIFSFSYDKVDPNVAHDVLAGSAVGEYDKLIQQVRAEAPAQKLVLATRVTTTGVKSIDGDRAELLVFLDQVATRVDTGKTSGSAAALSITAEKQDGSWRIVSLIPR
nr:putative integral membrane protein [Kibdelosporangium sp. MJ126-NF4]